jgi:hypothetical protein
MSDRRNQPVSLQKKVKREKDFSRFPRNPLPADFLSKTKIFFYISPPRSGSLLGLSSRDELIQTTLSSVRFFFELKYEHYCSYFINFNSILANMFAIPQFVDQLEPHYVQRNGEKFLALGFAKKHLFALAWQNCMHGER